MRTDNSNCEWEATTTTPTRRDDLRVILDHMKEAEEKAIDSLARYKFQMFGYWAGVWVHLNKLTKAMGYHGLANPFGFLVGYAREARARTRARLGSE